MDEDNSSVRSPTTSELKTFRVLANLDFTDFQKPDMPRMEVLREDSVPRIDESMPRDESRHEGRHDREERHDDRRSLPRSVDDRRESVPRQAASRQASRQASVASVPRSHHSAEWGGEKAAEDLKDVKKESEADIALEKEALLYELDLMEKQGTVVLHRKLTMADSLESLQYQYDRANMIASTSQTVDWAKMGIKMGSGVIENVLKHFGVAVVDGFSKNLCQDMNKFNKPLTKMYRKYWRRGTSSPEMELAMIVFGALAMTIVSNKGFLGFGGTKTEKQEPFARPQAPPSESALRPPSLFSAGPANAPPAAPAGPASLPTASIPEWAKAAMAAPLNREPAKPMHYATAPAAGAAPAAPFVDTATISAPKAENTWPEEARPPMIPPIPVSVAEAPATKIINITSPKTSRRKKELATELNLDV